MKTKTTSQLPPATTTTLLLRRGDDHEDDLLRLCESQIDREDISMTVRLVVNCNGMKINTVRDSFEKSLRARLLKTNPDTDFNCLATFGSLFAQDIPLHAVMSFLSQINYFSVTFGCHGTSSDFKFDILQGTTIDFRQTADGHLITAIGGNQIGAVQSKELCTAFFDMYIGDVPVSEQAKVEIGRNVANIIRRC
ncbi:hypothetical protein RHMOL_Rhmol06G0143200 [Rhododendron molle]|uniref:Uncharacterized protein n=1 Tax=Rhododendron molle TaxID=49168 RepID=A0ACC0NCH5_RHOML|nr:hypothetical protein RHMOL_Rhmol06G0143200 [Rhododendron molle]